MRSKPLGTVCAPVIARSASAICSSAAWHSSQKKLTFVGDLDTSRCAGKEPHAQTVLQSADGPADGSRRKTEELGRRSEAAQLCRLAKLLDAAELHGVHTRHSLFQNVMNEVILAPFIRAEHMNTLQSLLVQERFCK